MKPTDLPWVPDWEPDEEQSSPGSGDRPSIGNSGAGESGAVLTDENVFDSRTSQHQALAEEVMEAEGKEHLQQAVAVAIPGVESGMLGFEDVTGRIGMATEEVEAAEQARSSDLVKRTISAVAMMVVVVMALYLGGIWLTGLLLVTMVVGLVEFYLAVRSAGYRPMALLGLLGALGAGVSAHLFGLGASGGMLAAAVALILLFFVAAARRMPVENSTVTLLGMMWMSLLCYGVAIGRAQEGVTLLVWVLPAELGVRHGGLCDRPGFRNPAALSVPVGKEDHSGFGGRGDCHLCLGCHFLHPAFVVAPDSLSGPLFGGGRLHSCPFGRRYRVGVEAVDGSERHELLPTWARRNT